MTARMTLKPMGRTIEVRPVQTLLDAALSAGINLPHSCRSGHCASCRAHLQEGEVAYAQGVRPPGLSADEVARGQVLLCQARAASAQLQVVVHAVARAGETEIRSLPCRVERRERRGPDVLQVFLRLPATEQIRFLPGQYLDVLMEDGSRRSFSIASPPHDSTQLELHVRRVNGGRFTARLFDQLRDGALLRIELPIGQFVYEPDDARLLLLAGGTGFAPIKSILRHIFEAGPGRPTHLFWGVRTAADLYELDWLRNFAAQHPQLVVTTVLSDPDAHGTNPLHEAGWVHDAALRHYPRLSECTVYAAGPPQMIEAIRRDFPGAGLPLTRLRFDSFDFSPAQPVAEQS